MNLTKYIKYGIFIYMYEVKLLEEAKIFIDSLDKKMKTKVLRTIMLLAKFGGFLKEPYSKKLKGYDLYELRVKFASNIVRLFYFHDNNNIYVITSGFIKKSDKIDKKILLKAINLKKQYEEDKKNENL